MTTHPTSLHQIQEELAIHAKDGRSDDLFRFVIMHAQIGDLAKHLSHDQILNPTARPHGTKESEKNEFGHALLQVMTYGILRDIDLQEAFNMALDNVREKDFIKRESTVAELCQGRVASLPFGYRKKSEDPSTMVAARVYLDPDCSYLDSMPIGAILVTNHPGAGLSRVISKIAGIVTDNGGTMCHAAIVCREFGIPCIVGTGDATKKFSTLDIVKMQDNGEVLKLTGTEKIGANHDIENSKMHL